MALTASYGLRMASAMDVSTWKIDFVGPAFWRWVYLVGAVLELQLVHATVLQPASLAQRLHLCARVIS